MMKRKTTIIISVGAVIGAVVFAGGSSEDGLPTMLTMALVGATIGLLVGCMSSAPIIALLDFTKWLTARVRDRSSRSLALAFMMPIPLGVLAGGGLGLRSGLGLMIMCALGGAWIGMSVGLVVASLIVVFTPSKVNQCRSISAAWRQQKLEIYLRSVALSALIGAILGMPESAVMSGVCAIFGAWFGPLIVMPFLFLVYKIAGRLVRPHENQKNIGSKQNARRAYVDSNRGGTDTWDNYRNDFPFYSAGDTDPVAKTLTGWTDASDISYHRDILS